MINVFEYSQIELSINMKNMNQCDKTRPNQQKQQTNPRYPSFVQTVYTAGDEEQFNEARVRQDVRNPNLSHLEALVSSSENLFQPQLKSWYGYQGIDGRDVSNTFRYIFDKFKKGIFVKISDGKLVNFIPFSNINYRNEFHHLIKVSPAYGSVQNFLDYISKLSGYRPSKALPLDRWYANNAMFRFEYQKVEGDSNVVVLKEMFESLCSNRRVPDLEFFINRRDYPILTRNATEPYYHIYDSQSYPLVSHNYDHYCPILSFSGNDNQYADVLFPTYEDWARAVYQEENGRVLPEDCKEYPAIQLADWSQKQSIAVFRGASTGAGVSPETNQRLHALSISDRDYPHLHRLDVGITKWNLRPRKYQGAQFLETIVRERYPKANQLTLQQQSSRYKYILNLEGHVAAYRLSYELSCGSVILLAASSWKMWYSYLLEPFVHYVPVRNDLSDLLKMIDWCRRNDDECRAIAVNAKRFYDTYLGRAGILDFLQMTLVELARETGEYRYIPSLRDWSVRLEIEHLKTSVDYGDDSVKYLYQIENASRSIGRLDGTMEVFKSKLDSDFTFVKTLFKNKNGLIDLFTVNGIFIVRKRAVNKSKELEHAHEAYIGLRAINGLIGKIPNFAYVYGKSRQMTDTDVYIEYVKGPTMFEWLKSSDYNFNDYIAILVQLNLALIVAQSYTGFVHYDLYPWNIIIQTLPAPIKIDYNAIGGVEITSRHIPVIIDYGKSRAIVAEEGYGMIDHGFVNLYRSSPLIDTLTILIASVKQLGDRLAVGARRKLMSFFTFLELAGIDLDYHSKYGKMFDMVELTDPYKSPVDFISHLVNEFGPLTYMNVVDKSFTFLTEKGNPMYTANQIRYGNVQQALLETMVKINRSTPPQSDDAFYQKVIQNVLERRLGWLDAEVGARGDAFVKSKWTAVRRMFDAGHPKAITEMPKIEYPQPEQLYLDEDISPSYVAEYSAQMTVIPDDWMTIMTMISEAVIFNILNRKENTDIEDLLNINLFNYYNAIASNNTVMKIRDNLI